MCDFIEMYEARFRRAREDHQCAECDRRINSGERYEVTTGKVEGSFFSEKRCARCAKLRSAMWSRYRADMECGLGNLFEELDAFMVDNTFTMERAAKRAARPGSISPGARLLARSRADEHRSFEEMERLFPAEEAESVT